MMYVDDKGRYMTRYGRYSKLGKQLDRLRAMAPWRMWREVESTGDPLLYRQVILAREGRETLVNVVRGAHGLPNKH
jgi:hypothetical protein